MRDINARNMAPAAALAGLQSLPRVLTTAEARQRLDRFGRNRQREKLQRPVWLRFIEPLKNLLVLLLIGVGGAGALTALGALKHMLARQARMRRGSEVTQVEAHVLVPGLLRATN